MRLTSGRYMNILSGVFLASAITITACSSLPSATPTPYKSAKLSDGYGYSSMQLSENEYRVMFKATEKTPADLVQEYTLYRAAEIADKTGFDWVAVVKTDVEKKAGTAKNIVRDKSASTPALPSEQQCTMSGCSEVAQPFPQTDGSMTVEETPMSDVYYSIMVRMGNADQGAEPNALLIKEILSRPPGKEK